MTEVPAATEQVQALLAEGSRLWDAGAFNQAEAAYAVAQVLAPDSLLVRFSHSAALKRLGRHAEAEAGYRVVLTARPDHTPTLNNLAALLMEQSRWGEAAELLHRAVALPGNNGDALANLGAALLEQGAFGEAAVMLEQAVRLRPDDGAVWRRLGIAKRNLRAIGEAEAALRQALCRDPEDAEALLNLGNTLLDSEQPEAAEAIYRKLIALMPHDAGAHYALGVALEAQERLPEAIAALGRALACDPGMARAAVERIHHQMQICDWRALDEYAAVADTLGFAGEVVSPGGLLAIEDDPARQRARAQAYAARFADVVPAPFGARAAGDGRIRIGYFSADFHDHATMHLMAGLFRTHDRTRFEITAYSYGLTRQGAQRDALIAHVDRFVDVAEMPDAAIVDLARGHALDIAVDLKGYTQENRLGLFAHRLAPVQIGHVGYPGTSGTPFLDYIVADQVIIPAEERAHYSEHVIRLPGSYQPNDDRRPIAPIAPGRAALGLPETGFVFACFNNAYKITPREFDIWMRLLAQVPGSVLWLFKANYWAEASLRREASARGIAPERLIFAPWAAHAEHLARLRCADLFLDTFACNAHTTASDALWAGVPVLTRPGRSFIARVAASLTHAVGLPEMAAGSDEAYEALALTLAQDPARLAEIRTRLAANRTTTALFDTLRYTRALEAAYTRAHERHVAGLAPEDFDVGLDAG